MIKSFASNEKAKFWSNRNNVTADQVSTCSNKKYWFLCETCGHEFQQSPAKITNMGRWCIYCANQKRCNDDDCQWCFDRSFASSEKATCWSPSNGNVKPRDVAKYANKPAYFFICDVCSHEFSATLNNVTQGKWCPYCINRIRCDDGNCEHCFANSFASHPKSQFWSDKNESTPRMVALNDNQKYWFTCEVGHEIQSSPSEINGKNYWCKKCSDKLKKPPPAHKRCFENPCDKCYRTSFIHHERAKFWSPSNGKTKPEHVALGDDRKFKFICGDCSHEFEARLTNVTTMGQWCPYCENIKRCERDDCTHCFNNSFASHEKSEFWSLLNGDITPRMVALQCNKKYYFNCNQCNHLLHLRISAVVRGNWCAFCTNKARCADDNCIMCFNHSFASHPFSQFWSDDRATPRQIALCCGDKYQFTCGECNNSFMVSPSCVVLQGTTCPHCQFKTQRLVLSWLHDWFEKEDVVPQKSFKELRGTKFVRRFDFAIESKKIILELDGKQHFVQVKNWQTQEETCAIDKEKMIFAIQKGYKIIRICQRSVWRSKKKWQLKLKEVLSLETLNNVTFLANDISIYKHHHL